MLYLYLGFLLAQSHSVIKVIYNANIPPLTIVFSITVFMVWSFIPVLGYPIGKVLAKYTRTKSYCNMYVLFGLGCSISFIEQALFYFEIFSKRDGYYTMIVTASLFFATAFLALNSKQVR